MGAPRRPLSPRWPRLLLLLLLGGLGRARASLRLLDLPGPVCAQQSENLEEMSPGDHMSAWPDYEWYEDGSSAGVAARQTPQELRCVIENSSCFDDSWIRREKLTPSPPKITHVHLHFAHTQHGELLPTLHVEWTLKGDSSFQTLKGAELSVLQLNTNERLCVKFKFLSTLNSTAWRFNFSHFVVEPGQMYEVTVNHLPRSGSNGDPNHESRSFSVPGCRDPRMKMTTPCVSLGSLWDPNLTAVLLGSQKLGVLFTAWNESAPYQVLLNSFPRAENRSCLLRTLHIPAPSEENFQQQVNVTLSLQGSWCCRHHVQLQPFFSSCLNDCLRFSVTLDCPALADAVEPVADSLPLWAYWLVTGVALLLVASVILFIARVTWRLAGSHHEKSGDAAVAPGALPPDGLTPPPLKPKKVWIVYSADHPLYVDVVLKFAQFLLTVCGTEVALDLLEERVIAEVGVVTWVGRRKQEMVETGSKIIVLCSRGTRAKWQAMLGWGQPSVQLRCDHGKPAGDLFTAAMNVILPDFRKPACFGTYIVCYFSAISSESDVPELFDVTCRYPLMDGLEELYFRVQDLEMFAPGHRRRVGALAGENYLQSASGRQLKAALEHFQDWQAQHPDWFERENLGSAESQELPALDEDVAQEPLLPLGGGITRQWPLVREPAAQDCLVLDLLLGKEGRGVARLEAQLQPQGTPDAQVLQTQVFPLETVPPAHITEPVLDVGAGCSTAGRVVLVEPSEACPLPDGGDPRRNSVLFLSQITDGPGLPLDVVRRQGGGWSLPVFQQSRGCPAQALWVSPSAGLKGQHGPSEEEQSDQGYISRGSPQPPETLSPADLASLRSLQQQLFFQDLQRDSGWASVEAEAPAP